MKTRYVYYDKVTGQIKEILSKKKGGRSYYIECDNKEVVGFIKGTKGINQWIVAYNKELEKHVLVEKNNMIMLKVPDSKLYKIPYRKNTESDLKLTYYPDNVLEVTLDVCRIAPLYQTNFRDEVKFEPGTEIRIIAKEKKSGKLLKELIIEAQDLLDAVQIFFELPPVGQNDVEFFTYNLFENYSWSKGSVKLISPMKEGIKYDIHKADHKVRSKNFSYHLIVTPTDTGVEIQNNIESLKLIRFDTDIEFFIVDRHDPNILHEKFSLGKGELLSKKISVMLKGDMEGKTIIYNHKYISVLLDGRYE